MKKVWLAALLVLGMGLALAQQVRIVVISHGQASDRSGRW